jgi:hypothetical protein
MGGALVRTGIVPESRRSLYVWIGMAVLIYPVYHAFYRFQAEAPATANKRRQRDLPRSPSSGHA